ncbi:choloylglycine hydrolase family protein [Clostridium aminobutyricum]|uniref:Choloylglycine hydrolase family protein n=1 Tax=Clostridium aminobutyricum TaxID=33953 RepID=A0A939IHR6_CLOAM|nr:choloylglycine hydrolase family protein [Clostridium aminobutyricum]MBN7774132.1 choloylglycine hydrolase family protein [Clostridium aminobutyricum]
MCTAITLQSQQQETFFGRTMDFSYDIDPHLYIVPKDYVWDNILNMKQIRNNYSFIGIGQQLDGLLSFFDGVNEKGFAAAALYFAGYAKYDALHADPTIEQIASFDFLHYILGKCASTKDLNRVVKNLSITGLPDPVTQTVAPLHWIAVDRESKCVVIEQTERGLEILDNPIGVMANSPDFQWHMTNLRNYVEVSPKQVSETAWGSVPLKPFGQGGGTVPLPGGYTAPERFVRTAYLKTHVPVPYDGTDAVVSCFHIMDSVSIPEGAVITDRNTYDYTKYTAFMNTNTCEYFFKTYDNVQIGTARLLKECARFTQVTNLGKLNRPISFEKI